MTIPDFQTIMLPLLKFLSDGYEHSTRETIEHIIDYFKLSEEEKRELLPSGRQPMIDNRVGWSRTYLKKAGLIDSARRGWLKITERGRDVLKENPPVIDVKYLERFPELIEFRTIRKHGQETVEQEHYKNQTPSELLESGYERIRSALAQDLLESIKGCSYEFFERLVVELLLNMGYGGSRKDAGEAIGKSGDGGVDGIIKEDKLGLDVIYLQAKRWDGTVGRPEIQKFVGALHGQRAKKGIFITTSDFSKDAKDYVSNIETKIVLIDGQTLAQYMIDNDVGVSKLATYEIKRIDSDYFVEDYTT
jgi:restriction system protein